MQTIKTLEKCSSHSPGENVVGMPTIYAKYLYAKASRDGNEEEKEKDIKLTRARRVNWFLTNFPTEDNVQ